MADTAGIDTIRARIANLSQLLAEAQTGTNQAKITNLQDRLRKNQTDLQMRLAKQSEIGAIRDLARAQKGVNAAQFDQQIGQARVAQEGDLLQSQRDLEAAYREWLAGFGGRDMLRSGVYQQAVKTGEEDFALQRGQIVREYNQEIMGLEAQRMAGANEIALNRAAQLAQLKAAYRLARLNAATG